MLFNSLRFLLFFPAVCGLFFATPHRWRWLLLLSASYLFYMGWRPEYLALIVLITLTSYVAARVMDAAKSERTRLLALLVNLGVCGGVLFLFKYLSFALRSVNALSSQLGLDAALPYWHLILPVGVSFYTFQTLSYSLDVYLRKRRHDNHLGVFSLYVAFFPQLVAGPIERSTNLMPQFYEHMYFDYDRAVSGLRYMLWGMFKKVVVADNLARFVTAAYGDPSSVSGGALLTATVFFSFQIYCDFSGYSDIAIGAARIMGFRLMRNFDAPYFSRSIAEFWRRWHISLSTWFRDYLYLPLGGSRGGQLFTYRNYMIVFLVSGLWHGAAWTFIIWGGIHGALLVGEDLMRRWFRRPGHQGIRTLTTQGLLPSTIRRLVTFSLVTLSWVFFRARSLAEALTILRRIGGFLAALPGMLFTLDRHGLSQSALVGQRRVSLLVALYGILVLVVGDLLLRSPRFMACFRSSHHCFRLVVYFALLMSILLLGNYADESPFIYFQF
jgi:alginate O-acetyltransferase complex protein AlgI